MAKGFNLTAEINLRGPSNIRQVVGNIRKQLTGINANVNVKLNPQTAKQINAANQAFKSFNKTLQQTTSTAKATAAAFGQLSSSAGRLSGNLRSIPQSIQKAAKSAQQVSQSNAKAAKATQELTSEFAEFGKQSALAVRRFAAFATVTGAIYRVSNAISSASKDFLDFQKELIKVSQVTNTSLSGLDFLVNRVTQLSTGLGVSSQELIGVSRTLSQAGLSATETSKALQALARSALAPTFDSLNNTVEGSIALMKQFSISANQLEGALGSINAVAGKFAVEASDIITAISRTGGVFASASKGVSQGTDALNEFIAVFTSVRATTRESAETIATGLRTIFTRIQREDTIDALKAYGVALTDLNNKFVGPYEATRRLAEGLSQLDPRDIRFSRIVEELGGFRQIGKVIPLIQQFATAQAALNVAQRGSGSLASDAATAQLGLANQISKVQEQFSALIRSIGQSQGFRDLARVALDITSGLIAVADAAKSALPALTAIFAIKGFSALTQFTRGFAGGLSRTGGNTLNKGGYVHHFARGGVVPGSGNRDTVPAMLQPGEFVIRKKAVEAIGRNNLARANRYAGGGGVKSKAIQKGRQVAGVGIFDSDMIGAGSKDVLNAILGSGKSYDVVSGPAGSGKTTFATRRFGKNFVLSANDLSQYSSFVVLSGAGPTKAGGFSPQAQQIMSGARKIIALQIPEQQVMQQRQSRLDQAIAGNVPDKRSTKQLEGTLKAPTAIGADLYKQFKNVDFVQRFNIGGQAKAGMVITEVLDKKQGAVDITSRNVAESTPQVPPLASGSISSLYGLKGKIKAGAVDPNQPNLLPSEDLDRVIGETIFGGKKSKSYQTEVAGVGVSQNKVFNQAIQKYTKHAITKSAKAWGRSANIKVNNVAFADDFQLPGGQVGSMFEQMIQGLKGEPIASAASEDKRPFDFIKGIGRLAKKGDTGLFNIGTDIKYIDAKKSLANAGASEFLKKISSQLTLDNVNSIKSAISQEYKRLVQQQNLSPASQNILSNIEPDKAYTLDDLLRKGVIKNKNVAEATAQGFEPYRTRGKYVLKRNLGGEIKRFAVGGSAEDTVPALLTPGEFVINKKAASRIGSQRLHKLNKADKIQGFNKGGAVGRVQRFANGGDVFEFSGNFNALDNQLESILTDAILDAAKAAKAQSGASGGTPITSAEALRQARGKFDPTASFGLKQAAETGDQKAAEAVYAAQRKQVVAITKQIRASNKGITIAQAKQAAEQRVGQAWGGLVTKVKKGTQVQQQVNQSGQQLAQSNKQNAQTQTAGTKGAGRGINLGNLGTTLAFTGPLLAGQLGEAIGGTTGAGVSGAATAFSSSVGLGAQFGPVGALVGGLAGAVTAVEAFASAVAAKEAEIAQTKIDDALQRSEKAFDRFGKNVADVGAFTDIANAIKTIRQQEEELSRAQKEAEAPGLFTRAGRSLGLLSTPTAQEIGGAEASRQRGGAEAAQKTIEAAFAGGLDLKQLQDKLSQSGQSLDLLIQDIINADSAYQEEIAKIKSKNLSSDAEARAIEVVKKEKIKEQQDILKSRNAQILTARANATLTKALQVYSASITKTFTNLNQSIAAASNSLKDVSAEMNKIVTGATGFTRSLESLNVIQNPRAFSRDEQNRAIRQGSQFAGPDRAFMEQMTRFSLDVNDIISGIAASDQKAGVDPQKTAQKTIEAVTKRLEDQFGRSNLTEQIRTSLTEAIKKAAPGEDIDLQKLIEEKIPEFNIGKQSIESTTKALQLLDEALKTASGGINEYAKIQQTLRDNQANYQNTLLQSDLALKEALGQRVSVQERIGARTRVDATRAGVVPSQLNTTGLRARRDTLETNVKNLEDALDRARNAFDSTIPGAADNLIKLEKRFASAENQLKATEAAIANLPRTIEANINDIIGEIGRIQQEASSRQQAGASFAERLVGSTPQELAELSSTFNVLNNTLNGQITTINQSQAAQQAYFQSLRNGSTQQEAYAAAQQAFAGQTKSALGLFNELTQLSGLEGPEINNIRADLLEGFARAQGMGVQNNPMFQQIIAALRKPPEQSPEIIALTKALDEQQARLAEAQRLVNEGLLNKQAQILSSVNKALIDELRTVEFKFNQAQIDQIGMGIDRPGRSTGAQRLDKGGVVYASQGKYVNYQPKGTDTVPAMLTPGEFVVNAKASKNNLGLLRAINSSGSGKTFSRGGVVYAAGGASLLDDISAQTQALFNANRTATGSVGSASTAANNSVIAKKYFQSLSNLLNYIGNKVPSLKGINIPNLLKLDLTKVATSPASRQFLGKALSVLGPVATLAQRAYVAYQGGGVTGALTGSARGGGDIGAERSIIGSTLGVERGSYTDLAAGNLTEFGLALSEGAAAGQIFGPPGALVGATVAGGAQIVGSTAREIGGLRTDAAEERQQAESTRLAQNTSRARDLADSRENQTANMRPALKDFSPTERGWIVRRAKLKRDLEIAQSKKPPNQDRINDLNQQIQTHESGREQAFSQRVQAGYLWSTTGRERTDAEIDKAVGEESSYQQRSAAARKRIDRQERERQIQADLQAERQENEYQQSLIDERKKKEQARKELEAKRQRSVDMGLRADATDQEIKDRQKQINADWTQYKQYQQNNKEAEKALKDPYLPPNHPVYDQSYKDAIRKRQEISDAINERSSVTFDSSSVPAFIRDNPTALANYERQWRLDQEQSLRQLHADLNQQNQTITQTESNTKAAIGDGTDKPTRDQLWTEYKKGKDKEAKIAQKNQRKAAMQAATDQANAMRSAAQYANLNIPDKFANTGAFLTWRKNLQARLQRDFPFGSQTPDALQALGIPSNLLDSIYKPFSPQEQEAVYSSMLSSGGLGADERTYIAALRQVQANASKKIENDPRLQQIISSASPQVRAKVGQKFGSTFGKQARQLNRFNTLVGGFQNLDTGRQMMARANLLTRLTRQGLIDPRASDEDNMRRLTAFNGGAVASFMYPTMGQTQNRALRFNTRRPTGRSSGGIIYASTGMMVPYQPRGTDTVPAMLTPGEFVINRAATQKHRPLLEAINKNKGGAVKYLADGGSTDVTKYVQGVPIERENETAKNVRENLRVSKDTGKTTSQSYSFARDFRRDSFKDSQDKYDKSTQLNTQGFDEINSNADQAFGSVFDQLNFLVANAASERFQPANMQQALAFGNIQAALDEFSGDILGFSRGGSVPLYAQKGMMVNYQPKGTDTVPAMLTPGEFVVNAKASKENLGLLQAINSGYMSDGGVVYAQNGGIQQQRAAAARRRQIAERNLAIKEEKERQAETNKAISEMMKRIAIKPAASAGLGYKFVQQEMRGQIGANIEQLKGQAAALSGSDIAGWTPADGYRALSETIRNGNSKYGAAKALINQMRQMQANLNSFMISDAAPDGAGLVDAFLLEKQRRIYTKQLEDEIIALKQSWVATNPQLQAMYGDIQGLSKGGIVYAKDGQYVDPITGRPMPKMVSTIGERPNLPAQRKIAVPTSRSLGAGLSTTLSTIGMVPGFGEPFDLAAAGVDALMGDYTSAGLSLASMIPVAGMGAGAAKVAKKSSDILGPEVKETISLLTKKRAKLLPEIKSLEDSYKFLPRHLKDLISNKSLEDKASLIREYYSLPKNSTDFQRKIDLGIITNDKKVDITKLSVEFDRVYKDAISGFGGKLGNGSTGTLNTYASGRGLPNYKFGPPPEIDINKLSSIEEYIRLNNEINSLQKQQDIFESGLQGLKKQPPPLPPAMRQPPPLPPRYRALGGIVYAQKGRRMSDRDRLFGNQQADTFTGKSDRGIPFGEFLLTKSSYKDEKEGEALQAFGIGAAKGVGPTAAGVTAGTYTTATTAPILGPAAPLAGLIAGVGAAGLTAASQEGYLDFLAPQANAEANRITSENPLATNLGGALPGVGVGLAQQGLRSFAGTLTQRAVGGGASAGIGAGIEYATTGNADLTNLGVNFGTGFAQPGVGARPRTAATSKALEESFTVYHGGGSRLTTDNIDVTRGGGIYGEALYISNEDGGLGKMAAIFDQTRIKSVGSPMQPPPSKVPPPPFLKKTTSTPDYDTQLRTMQEQGGKIPNLVGDAEKPLFSRDLGATVTSAEIAEKLASDRRELFQVAELLTEKLGRPVTPVEANQMLTTRAVELLKKSKTSQTSFNDIFNQVETEGFGSTIKKGLFESSSDYKTRQGLETNREANRRYREAVKNDTGELKGEQDLRTVFDRVHNPADVIIGSSQNVMDVNPEQDVRLNLPVVELMKRGIYQNPSDVVGGVTDPQQKIYPTSPLDFYRRFYSTGGIVYANQGMLVPYQPKGTDTVPAMLTPGEFVVNREATRKHLPTLQSMNNGGRVSYLADGTPGTQALDTMISNITKSLRPLPDILARFSSALQQNIPNPGTGNATGNQNGVNTNGIQQFTTAFNGFIQQLQKINIPAQINITAQHTVDVRILGGDVFAQLEPGIREMIINETSSQIRKFGLDNFDNIA